MPRTTKIAALAAVVLVAGASAGYVFAQKTADDMLETRIAEFRQTLPASATLTISAKGTNIFRRSAFMEGVELRDSSDGSILTVGRADLTVEPTTTAQPGVMRIGAATLSNVALRTSEAAIAAEHLALTGADVTILDGALQIAHTAFDRFHARAVTLTEDSSTTTASSVEITAWRPLQTATLNLAGLSIKPQDTGKVKILEARAVYLASQGAYEAFQARRSERPAASFLGPNQSIDITGLKVVERGAAPITAARIAAAVSAQDGQSRLSGEIASLHIAAVPESLSFLRDLNYDSTTIDAKLDGTADTKAGVIDIKTIRFGGPNTGTLDLALRLENVPSVAFTGGQNSALEMLNSNLRSLNITYTDASLAQRAITNLARLNRQPEDIFREQMATTALMTFGNAPAPTGLRPVGNSSAPLPNLGTSLAKFIRQPGTITINARPPRPLPIAALGQLVMMAPNRMVETLGLIIDAR